MKNPCFGCTPPKRTLTCHDTCPEYKEWKQPLIKYKQQIRYENTADSMVVEHIMKRKKKQNFRKRRYRK